MWELFSVRAIEGSDPQENALHSQACPPPTLSTAAPKKLTVQAGKLKYRICCTRSDRGDVQLDLLKAQVSFGENSEPCGEGKASERGEKAGQSAGTLRCRPNELLCSLLVLWPLICRVSYHQLSFAFEMLIYTSAVQFCTTFQLFFLVVQGWANWSCEEPAKKTFSALRAMWSLATAKLCHCST